MTNSKLIIHKRNKLHFILLILIASCNNPKIDIAGDWQSAYSENDYSEASFIGDSMYIFSELSLVISSFRYEIDENILLIYSSNGQVLQRDLPAQVVIVDDNRFYLFYNDSSKQLINRINPNSNFTLGQARYYGPTYDSFYNKFWERRLDYLLSMGISPRYKYLEPDSDLNIDSVIDYFDN